MTARTVEKIDLFKQYKHEYAQPKKPQIITVGEGVYLATDGSGAPEDDGFQQAMTGLYGMAYTLKFDAKAQGRDFGVCKLEAIWPADDPATAFDAADKSQWKWMLMIRVPEFITADALDQARATLRDKGKEGNFDAVDLRSLTEGECVQMLHVGPYDQEGETIALMHAFAAEQGLVQIGNHHEIYLSDPRRVPPERLRTILRQPVAPADG